MSKKELTKKEPSKIAKNLRKFRAEKKLSKSKLVTKTGLDYHTIAKIENGITADPRVYTMVKIAHALEKSVEELVN
jgi:transcriptional regulator with XRE-family HTH domain